MRCLGLIVCLLSSSFVNAQQELSGIKDLSYGTLANGFQYFIKHVDEPLEKTSLRFHIKAGFDHEDTTQLQLAHLLEHVAFKPTEHTPKSIKNEAFLTGLGMSIRDIGGTTSNINTRYSFDAPRNNNLAFQTGLNWFKDIAMNLPISQEHINQEKGAVLQELISSSQDRRAYFKAERNLEAQMFPFRQSYDHFSGHIQNVSQEALRRFYKDWYRPDLMAVIIVGNFKDRRAIERHIQQTFSEIPEHKEDYPQVDIHEEHKGAPAQFKVQPWDEGFDAIEQKVVEYRWYIRQPELVNNLDTQEGYQQYIAFQLLCDLLYYRYQVAISSEIIGHVRPMNTYQYGGNPFSLTLHFKTYPIKSKTAFQQVVTTLLQLKKDGVYPNEWEKVKASYVREAKKSLGTYWDEELKNYWLKNEVLFPNKQEVVNQWVKDLSIKEMNAYITEFLSSMPQDIGVIVPKGNPAKNYTEEQVREWIKAAYLQSVPEYHPQEVIKSLYSEAEKRELRAVAYYPKKPSIQGTQEIILANGIRVVLHSYTPTKGIGSNSLKITGWTPRGAACFAKEDYYSALNAPSLLQHKGMGDFSTQEIDNFMEHNNIMNCHSYIDYNESSLQAEGEVGNAEELFQLLSLYFPPFLKENIEFESWKTATLKRRKSQNSIYENFRNAIRQVVGDSAHPPSFNFRYLKGNEAIKSIAKTDKKRSVQIHKEIFGAPKQWTFLITGDFTTEALIPLVQKYLGNVKQNAGYNNCALPNKKEFNVKTPIKKELQSPTPMENVMYDLSYYRPHKNTVEWKESLRIKVFGEVLKRKLNRLRYEMGFSVYNFGAYGRYNPDEKRYRVHFKIACQPKELIPIQKEIQLIIEELRAGEIPEAYIKQAKERIRGRYQKSVLRQHRPLHQLLFEHLRYQKPWVPLEAYEEFIVKINRNDMQHLARKYFQEHNKVEVIMQDEKV